MNVLRLVNQQREFTFFYGANDEPRLKEKKNILLLRRQASFHFLSLG